MIHALIYLLFGSGCLAYLYGIYKASSISLQANPDVSQMPAFLSNVVTSIGAVLATNLGAVTGVLISGSDLIRADDLNPTAFFTNPSPTHAQTLATFIYVLCLIAVAVVWGIKKFTTDTTKVVAIIPEMTKTLLGVIVGVFAVVLAQKK